MQLKEYEYEYEITIDKILNTELWYEFERDNYKLCKKNIQI